MKTAGDLLLETARRGELHHAVIIHGPLPQPLRDLAVGIAKTLNCLNRTTGDGCTSCQKIERRIHPDVHFVEVASEKKSISIEQVRDLVGEATLRPYEGRTKVFIIDPADALSTGGSNSLLKTLEEPARDTTFLLLTRSTDLLLPTIRSRSQSIYVGATADRAGSPEERRVAQISTFASRKDETAATLSELLERFATKRDSTALLTLAAAVASHEEPKDAMALLALVLTSESPALEPIPRESRLAAADALMFGIDAVRKINADARLVVEGALAKLV